MDSTTARTEAAPPTNRLHWLILGVCGALLGLMLVSGTLAIRFFAEMREQQQAVTQRLTERTQKLSGLWLSVQSYNEAVRQFVAQAGAERDRAAKQHLDQLTLAIASDLKRYPLDRDSMEAALLSGMHDVFVRQQTLYVSVLEARPDAAARRAQMQNSQQTAALQKQILNWSEKIQTWNGQQLQHADQALVSRFGDLQNGLSRVFLIGFASGLLLVLVSMAYIVRLERQTYRRYLQLADSQRELQRLSARLLDAQETERRSIARELHDEVGQALGALLVDIGRLSSKLSNLGPEMRNQIDHMKSVAEGTVQSVRNMALLLRPSMLDDLGLVAALEWQGREISRRSDIEVDVESEEALEDLPDEYRICIYRIVQEALNNAVRHSGAHAAKVTLQRSAAGVSVRVTDDGRGFNPERTRGLGILGMEERVKRLGGNFLIDSKPGQGATLTAELPLPAAASEAA